MFFKILKGLRDRPNGIRSAGGGLSAAYRRGLLGIVPPMYNRNTLAFVAYAAGQMLSIQDTTLSLIRKTENQRASRLDSVWCSSRTGRTG